MREALEQHYQHCRQKGCIEIHPEPVSYYEDPPTGWVQRVADADYDETRHFRVRNPAGRPVLLIANDKCLIGVGSPRKPKDRRCDCVFAEGQDVCFVEFKLPAEGREEAEDRNNQRTRLEDARLQLTETVLLFENNGWIEPWHRVRAYAHIGAPVFPAINATILNEAELFDASIRYSVDFEARNDALF